MRPGQENLRPPKTSEEARERGAKGGKKSGEVRRRKRNIQECTKMILESGTLTPKAKAALEKIGVNPDDLTYYAAVSMSMINKALQGDVQAARLIVEWDTAGQTSKQAEEQPDPLSAAFEALKGEKNGD